MSTDKLSSQASTKALEWAQLWFLHEIVNTENFANKHLAKAKGAWACLGHGTDDEEKDKAENLQNDVQNVNTSGAILFGIQKTMKQDCISAILIILINIVKSNDMVIIGKQGIYLLLIGSCISFAFLHCIN